MNGPGPPASFDRLPDLSGAFAIERADQAVWDAEKDGPTAQQAPAKVIMRFAPSPLMEIESAELSRAVERVIKTLTCREREVLKLRFGIDGNSCTSAEIAKNLKTSIARVRQIESKALRKMKHPVRMKHLAEFVE